MQIPSVMFIEMAMDALKDKPLDILERETKEFVSLGPSRQAAIAQTLAPTTTDPMAAGYLLGIETARALLATMPVAVQAGVTL